MILELVLALAFIAAFFVMLYLFKDYIITLIMLGSVALILGLVFYQYILWVAVLGLVFLVAMFFIYFVAGNPED